MGNNLYNEEDMPTSDDINQKYATIKKLENFSLNSDTGRISSDLVYVTEEMNKIVDKVRDTSFPGKMKEMEFERKDNVYATMNQCLNSYFDITGKLLDFTANEIKATMSYAQTFDDINEDLRSKAGDL